MWMQANCSKGELAELDRRQAASREQMVDAYARSVTESMEALADCLGQAFELDLVDADDFARAARRLASAAGREPLARSAPSGHEREPPADLARARQREPRGVAAEQPQPRRALAQRAGRGVGAPRAAPVVRAPRRRARPPRSARPARRARRRARARARRRPPARPRAPRARAGREPVRGRDQHRRRVAGPGDRDGSELAVQRQPPATAGRIVTSSPSATGVARPSRKRMSSPFR